MILLLLLASNEVLSCSPVPDLSERDFQHPDVCMEGLCVKPPKLECRIDRDCESPEVCKEGMCIDPSSEPDCRRNSDCPFLQVCQKGMCVGILGDVSFDGYTYKFIEMWSNHADAQMKCKEWHPRANLASIHSQMEQDKMLELLEQFDAKVAWIGGTDVEEEGKWRWVDGSK